MPRRFSSSKSCSVCGTSRPTLRSSGSLRENRLRRSVGDDPALGHGNHTVCARSLVHVMGNQNDRHAGLMVQSLDSIEHLAPSLRVEHGGRLVKHDALRLHSKNARDSHTLLLAAGQKLRGIRYGSRTCRLP